LASAKLFLTKFCTVKGSSYPHVHLIWEVLKFNEVGVYLVHLLTLHVRHPEIIKIKSKRTNGCQIRPTSIGYNVMIRGQEHSGGVSFCLFSPVLIPSRMQKPQCRARLWVPLEF